MLNRTLRPVVTKVTDSVSAELARMGRLSTLLKWHAADPPSASERLRNERVCTLFQHNRNPFVDRPELVVSIWGANQGPLPLPANRSSLGGSRAPSTGPVVFRLERISLFVVLFFSNPSLDPVHVLRPGIQSRILFKPSAKSHLYGAVLY